MDSEIGFEEKNQVAEIYWYDQNEVIKIFVFIKLVCLNKNIIYV